MTRFTNEKPYKLDFIKGRKVDPLVGIKSKFAYLLDNFEPVSVKKVNVYTDSFVIEEIVRVCKAIEMKYCPEMKRVLWAKENGTYEVFPADKLTEIITDYLQVRHIWALNKMGDDANGKEYVQFYKDAKKLDSLTKYNSMAKAVQARIAVNIGELDKHSLLLGTPDGVLVIDSSQDLIKRFGGGDNDEFANFKARKAVLNESIVKSTNASFKNGYSEKAKKFFDKFILDICQTEEKADFLKRALGYSIFGGNPSKATFVLWGATRDNGKSTLMNAIKYALGDYAGTVSTALFTKGRFDGDSVDKANSTLANLAGKRLVDMAEPPADVMLSASQIKLLSSGADEISVRKIKAEDNFTFIPQFTFWMHCNQLPRVDDVSALDANHMFVIPFERSFAPQEQDKALKDKLQKPAVMSYILYWLCEGYQDYVRRGCDLAAPECVTKATYDWLVTTSMWFVRFVRECCVFDSNGKTSAPDLTNACKDFCQNELEETGFTAQKLTRYLGSLNITKTKSNGVQYFNGIKLSKN